MSWAVLTKGLTFVGICCLALPGFSQLSSQGYATGYTGGVSSSANYSTEISTGAVSGKPKSANYGAYLGLAAFNLESAVVSVDAKSGGSTIANELEGTLLRIEEAGNYDTLDVVASNGGAFNFNPVFLGDFLINIDSDPEKYVATYFGDAFEWENAEVLTLTEDISVEINVTPVPPERNANTGDGRVAGVIEEDFAEEEGRIEARRRAKNRKCGLKRRRRGGRGEQDEFELIAYGETNDDGEFEFGFLPEGTYRFFVEYPGIPLDESSFVEFDIGAAGVSDNDFTLAAFVTEDGIVVELILGLTSEFFTDFSIYPNPTPSILNISYDKVLSDKMQMSLYDMNGKQLFSKDIAKGEDGHLHVDLSAYEKGLYLLKFHDTEKNKTALTFRVLKQ
ncbi:T9SS type A sorting domain-containing protein [Ekhidna sp.]|uniref:T9SS type A sorting domain-containing protein n=1 Tax=Ekhidna sp. TaxID=2608089 RepID=UPI003B5A65F2